MVLAVLVFNVLVAWRAVFVFLVTLLLEVWWRR